MKYIKKYNEAKSDNSLDLIDQIIDEISSVFNDDEWGYVTSTSSGPGAPSEYSISLYDEKIIKFLKNDMNRYNNMTIGFILHLGTSALDNINQYQEIFTKVKRLILNLSHLNLDIENLAFLDTYILSIRIYKK